MMWQILNSIPFIFGDKGYKNDDDFTSRRSDFITKACLETTRCRTILFRCLSDETFRFLKPYGDFKNPEVKDVMVGNLEQNTWSKPWLVEGSSL